MNFLAHLFVSEDSPDAMLGNLLGDFHKGPVDGRYPPLVNRGIRLHRAVDVFTNAHPEFKHCRDLLDPPFRRYAGIIVDLFYDHYLARDWGDYSDEALEDFTARVYHGLENTPYALPERLAWLIPRMIEEDLLGSYRERASMRIAVERIAQRLRRPNRLAESHHQFDKNYEALGASFHRFFPDLIAFAKSHAPKED